MISRNELTDAILDGILDANDFFVRISGGYWLSELGVENVIQCKVAEALHRAINSKRDEEYGILLEFPMKEFLSEAGVPFRGPVPSLISGSKRIDLVILDKFGWPIIPIEIKRGISGEGFGKDAARIVRLLSRSSRRRGGSAKYGFICGFASGSGDDEETAREKLGERIYLAEESIRSEPSLKTLINWGVVSFHKRVGRTQRYDKDIAGKEYWAPGAVCVYLRDRGAGPTN